MIGTDELLEVEKELGQCKHCQRDFRANPNKGWRTCDGCGAELPKLPRELFVKLMTSDFVASFSIETSGAKMHRTFMGMPFLGFK